MSNAGGDRSVLQAIQSHDVGSMFSAEECLQILTEIEDGYDRTVTSPVKQVDMSNAGGNRTVLQALQSHDVGSVFSAEEWLQILSEMEDTV